MQYVKAFAALKLKVLSRKIKYYQLVWLKHDLPAGIAVFLVALPLCLGIALASKAPLYAGLVSGIVGGIVVSVVSGSALGVSGPAAGLSTLVAGYLAATSNNFQVFLLSVIVAGVFQLALGIFRLGAIAYYFPSAVIKGMLAAIGIILISNQIPLALGYGEADFWTDGIFQIFSKKYFQSYITNGAIIIFLVSLAVLLLYSKFFKKRSNLIPASLVAVLVGVGLYLIFLNIDGWIDLQPSQLVNIPKNVFANVTFPDYTALLTEPQVWRQGIIIGGLASLETLLCVEAIDKMDPQHRTTPLNRELIAQGIGNIVCGILGALPITAVVVRGAANVNAGARTKLSAFTHGILLLIAVLVFPLALNNIPLAALAAILVVTGYNLTKVQLYRNMWQLGLYQFIPFVATIGVILITDLLTGVIIGFGISIYFIIQNNFTVDYDVKKRIEDGQSVYYIKLNTTVSFFNKVNLRRVLERIPRGGTVVIDGNDSQFIDYDIKELLSEFENITRTRGITLQLKGVERVKVENHH